MPRSLVRESWRRASGILSSVEPKRGQATEVVAVGEDRRRGQREAGPAGEEDGKCDGELGAGERRADAEVDAGAEGKMRTGWARGVEAGRVGEARGVAVGGGEQAADGVAGAEAVAEDLDVGERDSG